MPDDTIIADIRPEEATLKARIDKDLKTALLGGDKDTALVLRGLKSVILYAEVADGSRERGGLTDDAIITLFAKEAKKRQESADLYTKGGNQAKADAELSEKKIIETYLPAQLDEQTIRSLVDEVVSQLGASSPADMGKVIGAAKARAGASADGSVIARLVKERLAQASSGANG